MRTKEEILEDEEDSRKYTYKSCGEYENAIKDPSAETLILEVLLDIREQNEKIIQLLSSKSTSN
jgi:hypothetical protein